MKKFRAYEEGGSVNDEDLAAANASSDPIRELNRRKGWTKDADEPKSISFGESFRRAKDAGLKTFSFQGKQYTTKMASESKAAPAKRSSATSSDKSSAPSKGGMGASGMPPGSTDKAPAPLPDSAFKRLVKNNPSLEPVGRFVDKYGSDIQNTLNAMGGIGRLVSGPGRAMQAGTKAGSTVRDLAVSETPVRFVGASGKRLMNAPRLGSDAKKTGSELATTDAMKRGGKVKAYAKGGPVASASRRADGCATKGKTKCRIY